MKRSSGGICLMIRVWVAISFLSRRYLHQDHSVMFARRTFAWTFSPNRLDERIRLGPHQAIWRSAGNGVYVGGLVGIFEALLGLLGPLFGLFGLRHGLLFGRDYGLFLGLDGELLLGGLNAFLAHFLPRFWLWRFHLLPWKLVAFWMKRRNSSCSAKSAAP